MITASWLFPDAASGSVLGFRVFNMLLASIVVILYGWALWSRRKQSLTIYKGFLWGTMLYAVAQIVSNIFGIRETLKVTPSIYVYLLANMVSAFYAIAGTTLRRDEIPREIDPHGGEWDR